mgnify:CR=1 FL=1
MSIQRVLLSSTMFLMVVGCGGGGGSSSPQTPVVVDPPEPDPTGLWVRSDDDGEGLVSYAAKLTQIGATRSATGGAVAEAAPAADASSGGFSSTYTLEASVDEYDIVKYNGSTLAIAPTRSGCCFIAEPVAAEAALPPPGQPPSTKGEGPNLPFEDKQLNISSSLTFGTKLYID